MTMHLHTLKGCSPTPLASYLKALGILRLVGEQADNQARGWWDGEQFCLLTKLSKEELESFFLEKYEPTPLLSPWNKGCGFFKANDPGLCPLETSIAPRFKRFRDGVSDARKLLDEISDADAVIRAAKARTKTTAKGFQTEAQRERIESNKGYRELLQQLRERLHQPGLSDSDRVDTEREVSTLSLLTQKATKPATKAEAESLKASSGYKRFLANAERTFKTLKSSLIPDCRRAWRGSLSEWLSVAVVLDEDGDPDWPSLLGTGGNDGNLDFTNNFMQQIGAIFDLKSDSGKPVDAASGLLDNALWTHPANKLTSAAVGQYQPGSAGGANSSTGFASGNLVNPWDFVFMMEGCILFTCRATRRLDPIASTRASAPFSVRPHAAGFSTPGEEESVRGEQWMPLWSQPATLYDLSAMFGEARAQLNRQPANRPVDMARAISRLGVARGIESFVRYGYLERNGQSNLAVPLGRIQVRHHPRAYLIDDLAGWMNWLQLRSRDKNAPARLAHAERRLADSVISALTHDYTPDRWQAILMAAAEIEELQSSGSGIDAGPIPPLSPDWADAVADSSSEFQLALALGSAAAAYLRQVRPIDSIRHHFLPLEMGARKFKLADKRLINDPRVVASGRDAIRDFGSIVERRLVEAATRGQRSLPLVSAPGCGVSLAALARFLSGQVDLNKLLKLSRALMAVKWDRWSREMAPKYETTSDVPEESWMAIRLACLPWPLTSDKTIPVDQRLVRLLIAGDANRAIELANQRLRSAGIRSPIYGGIVDPSVASRWVASLAFPISHATSLTCMYRLDPRLDPKKGQFNG
jgi:CRISPR-associated protein Csx17